MRLWGSLPWQTKWFGLDLYWNFCVFVSQGSSTEANQVQIRRTASKRDRHTGTGTCEVLNHWLYKLKTNRIICFKNTLPHHAVLAVYSTLRLASTYIITWADEFLASISIKVDIFDASFSMSITWGSSYKWYLVCVCVCRCVSSGNGNAL